MLRPGYASELPVPEHAQREDVAVLAIVTVPANALEMTVNLMAPLLVDCRTRTGRQLVIDTGRYSTRHPIL
jgi:flagellar assembly factor FliW